MVKSALMRILVLICCAACSIRPKDHDRIRWRRGFHKIQDIRDSGRPAEQPEPGLVANLSRSKIEADIARDLTARGLTMVTGPSDLNVLRFGSVRQEELRLRLIPRAGAALERAL